MTSAVFSLAIILFLFSCKNKNEYRIRGSFIGEPTEEWIYLDKYAEQGVADSARIINGSFEFRGTVDFPEIYGLTYHPSKSIGICLFFLEQVVIEIVIDLEAWDVNSNVSGGLVNNEYNQLEQPNKEIMDLFYERSTASEERQKVIDTQIKEIGREYQNQKLEYIKNNPASPISIFLFSNVSGMSSMEEQGKYFESFSPSIRNTSIYKMLYKEYEEMISPEESTPSLAFNSEIEPLEIDLKDQPIIETLLNQNSGKHLFIDIWGTWCGPCFKEFPATRKLKSNMESKDITFVYFCLDCEEEPWKEMLQKEALKGHHYSVKRKLMERFNQETGSMAMGAPRYIVIDKTGKVINEDAPKPSSGKLEEILTEL